MDMNINMPLVCKIIYPYTYNKKVKEKPLYVLLFEYSPLQKAYYANFFEQNGKFHGRHYDRWLDWDENTILKYTVPMESLPITVLKSIEEQIEIFNEVNKKTRLREKEHDGTHKLESL